MNPNRCSVLITALLTVAAFVCNTASAQTQLFSPDAKQKSQALLKKMTLDEKIGQLNESSGRVMPGLSDANPDELISQGKVGSVLWINDVKEINRLQHIAVEKSRLHIPILFGFDVIHGYRTVFPVPLAMASSWDPSVEEQAQRFASQDARAAGLQLMFTPMVDIARDARWGRIVEGAGEDPYLGAAMARAQVKGFQGDHLNPDGTVVCVKHFAGYGASEGGRDYDSVYVPEELMQNVYLVPFHAAAQAGAGSFMSAYMDLNEVPASGNHWLLTDVLRKDWGFQGFVLSDAFAVGSLVTHHYAKDGEDAAYKGLTAGVNMDMASLTYVKNLAKLVKDGRISEAYIDEMVLPILETKYDLGLFEHPYADESNVETVLSRPEGLELERKIAGRSMVLLKNDNHVLPLQKSIKKIAVIGPLADSAHDIEGGWTVEGLFGGGGKSHPVTVLAGIKRKLGADAQIAVVPGPTPQRVFPGFLDALSGRKPAPPPTDEEIATWLEKTKTAAADADLIVAVMGETSSMNGEAASRATLDLPGIQLQMLQTAAATGKPVVLVLEGGRPLDIRWAADRVPAILEAWYPGTEGGNAVADVLFGDVNPGGKLPISWPRTAGSEPLYYNHTRTHDPEDEPRFTSRTWDVNSKPLYPFGYGLSYRDVTPLALKRKVRYGIPLGQFPDALRLEVEKLLIWKQERVMRGRPKNGRIRAVTASKLKGFICKLLGFAVNILGNREINSLPDLVDQSLLDSYVEWAMNERAVKGTGLIRDFGGLYAAMRYHPSYQSLNLSWFKPFIETIPTDGDDESRVDRKARHYLKYDDVASIPLDIYSDRLRAEKKGEGDPARLAMYELLIRFLVTFAWRQRNLRECRVSGPKPNLFKGPIPHNAPIDIPEWVGDELAENPNAEVWQARFSSDETKTKHTVHVIVPKTLVGPLEEYLNTYRPHLIQGRDPRTLFVTGNGNAFGQREMGRIVGKLTAQYRGVRVNPHLFRDIFAFAWLKEHPADYLRLSRILWHRDVNTTLRIYGARFNESSGVCAVDNWLNSRAAATN